VEGRPGFKFAYSQMRVVEAPNDLPDGEYTLTIDGIAVSTRKKDGSSMDGAVGGFAVADKS